MIFLSEYAEHNRIAQVFKKSSTCWCVEIFLQLTSQGVAHFNSEESAENYAESWVQNK
jgi:hypothetical protein